MDKMRKAIALLVVLFLGVFIYGADQPDFPDIYVNDGCAGTHVGSQANPYDDLSDINWTTGGDNSIFDYLAGSPSQSPTVYLKKGDVWRTALTVGCSGTVAYPITVTSYGTGNDPEIRDSEVVSTWTNESGNIWYASGYTTDPEGIWFINIDTTVDVGDEETNKVDLSAEYEWWWDDPNDRIYVYAATDPDSRYTAIEKMTQGWSRLEIDGHDYITIENLLFSFCIDTNGIRIHSGAENNIVQDCEFRYLRTGIHLGSDNNLVTRCDFHDLNIRPSNDDGAIGLELHGADCEVSYCTFERCRFESDAWGYDGGAIELYGEPDRVYIHHNWATECQGFLEAGNSSVVTVNDVRIEYNITLDNDKLTSIHLQGTYEIAIDNWHVYNNTCTETSGSIHSPMYAMIKFNGTGGSGDYYLRNNAFYMDGCNRFAQDWTTFDFDHNDYYLINSVGPGLNITPDGTDITGNPLFANLGGTSDVDYKLQSDSPCVNAGVDLNLTLDYFDVVVPQGTDEDMGAAECVFGHKGSVKPGNKLIIKPGGKVIIKEPLISWLNIIGGLIK